MALGRIRRRSVLAATGGLFASPWVARAQSQNGVALVVGNSKYLWETSLPNVRRDAVDIAKAFQTLGLKTELVQDADKSAMLGAIERFKAAAKGAKFAAYYYAGHGTSWQKATYLVPIDAELHTPGEVQGLIPIPLISEAMKSADYRLLVFDNCRNNPADGWRQREALATARVDTSEETAAELRQPGTLTLFSTAPGHIALDGPAGENSPFAKALLRQLASPTIDLRSLATKLRRDLLSETECRQLIWDNDTIASPFEIAGPSTNTLKPSRPAFSRDASTIIELRKVYDFCREKNLPLPQGLIAIRPPAGSPHADKVGAYKFDLSMRISLSGGFAIFPAALVVMSVLDKNTAEAIVSIRGANDGYGVRWRFLTCAISDNRLEFVTADERNRIRVEWRNRNSGTVYLDLMQQASVKVTSPQSFERLDG